MMHAALALYPAVGGWVDGSKFSVSIMLSISFLHSHILSEYIHHNIITELSNKKNRA